MPEREAGERQLVGQQIGFGVGEDEAEKQKSEQCNISERKRRVRSSRSSPEKGRRSAAR